MRTIHEKYINRCLQLAKNGKGLTYPNPMVGCVIVYRDIIIGEGWHHKAGEAHAEVNAIDSVVDKSLLKNATLYVSLEPCNHVGRTPACSNLIVSYQIPTVVVGCIDPHEKVAGQGIETLRKNGCNVIVGVLEDECIAVNRRFFTYHTKNRPYIILKWAETKDGFISPSSRKEVKPIWITNSYSRQLVHKWRAEEQAILVGTTTAILDNPKLDTRDWYGESPVRIVLDRNLKISNEYHLFDKSVQTIVLTDKERLSDHKMLVFEQLDFSKNMASQICTLLYRYSIQSLIVEGGAQMLQTFIESNLWDEARVFKGDLYFDNGVEAPQIKGEEFSRILIQKDILKSIKI